MKWGVRKDYSRSEYKSDNKKRHNLGRVAVLSSRWSKAYNEAEKQDTREVNRLIAKDMKRYNIVSDRTKARIESNRKLREDQKRVNNATERQIDVLQEHVNHMIDKYGNKKVKDLKVSVKNGHRYYNNLLLSDHYTYAVERRKTYDSSGNKKYEYVPIRREYNYT